MIEKKISIIVPVYNAEKTIVKCVDSLKNQTYENIEIILVNDGSTDGSLSILNQMAAQDDRIHLLTKENGGIGSAYAQAFEIMQGDYISFVDSDDWIEPDTIKTLIEAALNENADIVQYGMNYFDENYNFIKSKYISEGKLEGQADILSDFFNSKNNIPCLSIRFFKRALFDGYEFPAISYGIDTYSVINALIKSNKIVSISDCMYNCVVRTDTSVSREKITLSSFYNRDLFFDNYCNYIKRVCPEYYSYGLYHYITFLIEAYASLHLQKRDKNEYSSIIKKMKTNYNHIDKKNLSFKQKIMINMFILCPDIYLMLRSLMK